MENRNHIKSIAHDFQDNEKLASKRKEILGNLDSGKYAGYEEMYGGDTKKLMEKLQSCGIKVKKMWLLLDIRSKITGIKMVGLWIGPLIGIGKESKDAESTITHEAIHVKQYEENAPVRFLKARVGFIKFWILEQGKILKKLRNERKGYGTKAARRKSINNSPMEFEAYLHEWETWYLEKRKPFAHKQYETKEGRSEAVQEVMNQEYIQRLHTIFILAQRLETEENITTEDAHTVNTLIDELLQDAEKLLRIKQKYGKGDRELISTFKTPQWPMVRLESEKSRDKRLALLDKLLAKEHACIQLLKKYKNVKIFSSQADMDENGIIRIRAKDGDVEKLLQLFQSDQALQGLAPNMMIDRTWKPHIRISFTE